MDCSSIGVGYVLLTVFEGDGAIKVGEEDALWLLLQRLRIRHREIW